MDDDLDIQSSDPPLTDEDEEEKPASAPPDEGEPAEEEPAEEPAEEPEAAGEEKEEEEEEEEPEAINTLADMAKEFEVDEDTLTSHVKVQLADGSEVSLKDVIESYKEAPAVTRIAEQVAADQEALKVRTQEVEKKETEGLQQLAAMTDALLSEFEGEKIDWAKLEEEDSLLYLKKRDEYTRKRHTIGQALDRLRAADTEWNRKQEEGRDQYGREEARKLVAAHPTWSDSRTGQPTEAGIAAAKQIDAFLLACGYTQDEIDRDLIDHRQIDIVYQASELDRLKKKVPLARKRVREAPKSVLTARSQRREGSGKAERSQALRRRLAKTGAEDDAAAAIMDADILDL